MRFQISSFKFQIVRIIVSALICCCFTTTAFTEETKESKWPGVDESVVEKFAKEHGREAKEPFINTDQGDLLLFVFLLAGTAGGFIAGYYWRVLLEQKREDTEGDCPGFTDADRHRRIGTIPSTAKHGNI